MAAVRSKEGEVTAVQLTFLNSETAAKADLPVTKKSFGVVKGSAVTIQEEKDSNVFFIAEGVETALSLKEAGLKGTIKASLGLSNIKHSLPENPFKGEPFNGNPFKGGPFNGNSLNESSLSEDSFNGGRLSKNLNTQIIICADHDSPNSPAARNLEKSVLDLQEKGFSVTVIKPDKLNEDFNDVLKIKGPEGVREILQQNLPHNLIKDLPIPVPSLRRQETPKSKLEESEVEVKRTTFKEVEKFCADYLYAYLDKENRSLTPELKERITLQSEKAADFIFYAHTLKGTSPTEEQTKLFLLRAKYEFDRIPEIRRNIIKEWQREDNFNENSL